MRHSVPFRLIGTQIDVRLSDSRVTVMSGGEAVAEHGRLRGRKGQYSTLVEHAPPSHAAMDSPWSPERFSSWAHRIGTETGAADGPLASRPVVGQAFVPARNILGLSKAYSPGLLERACARSKALGAVPSYTSLKNAILAIRAADAAARASGGPVELAGDGLVDRAKPAGRLRGAEAYRRGGEPACWARGTSRC